jgi:hypothetical protein
MTVLHVVIMLPSHGRNGIGCGFAIAFAAGYLEIVPLLGLSMLQYSQQWQAANIFRAAPLGGRAKVSRGARRAELCFLAAPVLTVWAILSWMPVTWRDGWMPWLLVGEVAAVSLVHWLLARSIE